MSLPESIVSTYHLVYAAVIPNGNFGGDGVNGDSVMYDCEFPTQLGSDSRALIAAARQVADDDLERRHPHTQAKVTAIVNRIELVD